MKPTGFVILLCDLSLALAAEATDSILLPGYQHGYLHHENVSNVLSPFNVSSNVSSYLPPYYRNVTAGGAWVLPASPYDLGARAMSCECFDPDGIISIPYNP